MNCQVICGVALLFSTVSAQIQGWEGLSYWKNLKSLDKCSGSKPFTCIAANGWCFGYEEYCEKTMGKVYSCLPEDNVKALEFCQENEGNNSQVINPQCAQACSSRFNGTIFIDNCTVSGLNFCPVAGGQCYRDDQFCDKHNHKIQDCLSKNDEDAYEFCYKNARNILAYPNPQCGSACYFRFKETVSFEDSCTTSGLNFCLHANGQCYKDDQYCDRDNHKIQDCLADDDEEALEFCHKNVRNISAFPHPQCWSACYFRFKDTLFFDDNCTAQGLHICPHANGQCYKDDQFCENQKVQNCLARDDEEALEFCYKNARDVSKLPNPQCRYACLFRFKGILFTEDTLHSTTPFVTVVAIMACSIFVNIVFVIFSCLWIFKPKMISGRFSCLQGHRSDQHTTRPNLPPAQFQLWNRNATRPSITLTPHKTPLIPPVRQPTHRIVTPEIHQQNESNKSFWSEGSHLVITRETSFNHDPPQRNLDQTGSIQGSSSKHGSNNDEVDIEHVVQYHDGSSSPHFQERSHLPQMDQNHHVPREQNLHLFQQPQTHQSRSIQRYIKMADSNETLEISEGEDGLYDEAESTIGKDTRTLMQKKRQTEEDQKFHVIYRAKYDYRATRTDEVSFKAEDLIINEIAVSLDWMLGKVYQTGERGLVPYNYVERYN